MNYPDIYGLAGQSNMSGRGVLSVLPIFENYIQIQNYNNAGKWVAGFEPIDDAANQVDAVSSDPTAVASSSMSFANAMFNINPRRPVGLVPCAKGSSTIAQWARSENRSTLYGSMRARLLEAGETGSVKGLLFFQGESDTASTELANSWASSFLQFVNNCKSDFGSNFKIVFTVLGPNPGDSVNFPAWSTLVANQQALTLPDGVARVTAQDLPAVAEHLTTAGLVTLGQRYATAMASLLGY